MGGWFKYEQEFEQAEKNDTLGVIFTVHYESLKKVIEITVNEWDPTISFVKVLFIKFSVQYRLCLMLIWGGGYLSLHGGGDPSLDPRMNFKQNQNSKI